MIDLCKSLPPPPPAPSPLPPFPLSPFFQCERACLCCKSCNGRVFCFIGCTVSGVYVLLCLFGFVFWLFFFFYFLLLSFHCFLFFALFCFICFCFVLFCFLFSFSSLVWFLVLIFWQTFFHGPSIEAVVHVVMMVEVVMVIWWNCASIKFCRLSS